MKSRTQQNYSRWTGIVSVKTGEKSILLTSLDKVNDTVKLFPNDEEKLKVSLNDLPKEAKRVIKPNDNSGKQFRVRLNEDGDAIEAVQPVMGMFRAKLVDLGPHKKDMPPVPFVKTFKKDGSENSHLEFYASYEVTDGVFKGVILPAFYMHYKFEASEDEEGMTQFDTVDSPKASQLHKLQDWATVHGDILDEPIVWNTEDVDGVDNSVVDAYKESHDCEFANILPELQERALANDREVNVIIEKGYIKSVQAIVDYEDFSDESDESEDVTDDDIDEKFPEPKKTAHVTDEAKPKKSAVKKLSKKSADDEEL